MSNTTDTYHKATVPNARTLNAAKQRVSMFFDWPIIGRTIVARRSSKGDTYIVEWMPKPGTRCPLRSYPDGKPCEAHR